MTQKFSHSLPLVSCVLPTFNRKRFLPQTIKYFLYQTYENKELIIVDDGTLVSEDCIPKDDRIHYIRLQKRTSTGSKLNIAIDKSHGPIIQRWDDDDYYHPQFLATTVAALQGGKSKQSIVGFDRFLVLIAQTGELKFSGTGWCANGTLCFFRELWRKIPFQDLYRAADWYFLRDHNAQHIKVNNAELYILVRHEEGHVWTRLNNTDVTEHFRSQPPYRKRLEELLSGEDLAFYRNLMRISS